MEMFKTIRQLIYVVWNVQGIMRILKWIYRRAFVGGTAYADTCKNSRSFRKWYSENLLCLNGYFYRGICKKKEIVISRIWTSKGRVFRFGSGVEIWLYFTRFIYEGLSANAWYYTISGKEGWLPFEILWKNHLCINNQNNVKLSHRKYIS